MNLLVGQFVLPPCVILLALKQATPPGSLLKIKTAPRHHNSARPRSRFGLVIGDLPIPRRQPAIVESRGHQDVLNTGRLPVNQVRPTANAAAADQVEGRELGADRPAQRTRSRPTSHPDIRQIKHDQSRDPATDHLTNDLTRVAAPIARRLRQHRLAVLQVETKRDRLTRRDHRGEVTRRT